jgi:hypothetical protein
MKTSESQINLIAALLACQKTFPPIEKTKEGQAGNRKFKYAPLELIKAQCDAILRENGLVLTQGTMGHVVVTRLDHVSGEWREIMMPMNEVHSSDQAYGIEFSYKRRYSYTGILGIVTEEDVDGNKAKISKPGTLGPGESLLHTVRGGIGEDLAEDWKIYLRDLADECMALCALGKPGEAVERINQDKLDDDQRVYLENKMDSKTRAALKTAAKVPL